MKSFLTGCWAAVIYLLAVGYVRGHVVVQQMAVGNDQPMSDDWGTVNNCGPSPLVGKWTPKIISSDGQVTIFVNFTVPFDMEGGYAEVDVYNHADQSAVVQYGTPFTCPMIQKYIPCPVEKGQIISMEKTIPNLSFLADYLGTFDVTVSVSNDADEVILCFNATITVTS